MKTVTLHTIHDCGEQTLGVFSVVEGNRVIFLAKSLELPFKDNGRNISSYPAGIYLCKYTMSPAFKKKTYEITGVPNRAGIRIHSANYVKQLRGCTALGSTTKDLNKDGLLDVTHSGDTVAAFEKLMEYKDFYLNVIR